MAKLKSKDGVGRGKGRVEERERKGGDEREGGLHEGYEGRRTKYGRVGEGGLSKDKA